MHSLELMKLDPPKPAEASSLLDKIRFDPPLHTFLIIFTCLQIPTEVFFQICLFIRAFGDSFKRSSIQLCNLTTCLLLTTFGVVFYFRYETQNITQLSYVNLKRILHQEIEPNPTNTSCETGADPSLKILKPPGDTQNKLKVTNSHGPLFRVLITLIMLLHCYVRLVSIGLANFEEEKITGLFLMSHTFLFFLLLLFYHLKSRPKVTIGYVMLQSLLLNLCLIEYQIKLSNRRLVFAAYFLLMTAENVLFGYLFYSRFPFEYWEAKRPPGPYRTFLNGTLVSLIICQAVQLCLLFGYLICYKPEVYEIESIADRDQDEDKEKKVTARS